MSPQQKTQIDEEARALVRRLRVDNEDAARHGAPAVESDEYDALEVELRELLMRRAVTEHDCEPVGC